MGNWKCLGKIWLKCLQFELDPSSRSRVYDKNLWATVTCISCFYTIWQESIGRYHAGTGRSRGVRLPHVGIQVFTYNNIIIMQMISFRSSLGWRLGVVLVRIPRGCWRSVQFHTMVNKIKQINNVRYIRTLDTEHPPEILVNSKSNRWITSSVGFFKILG